jgi:hypothetical protein
MISDRAPIVGETMPRLSTQTPVSPADVSTLLSRRLVALKLDPDKDFRWIYFADAGLDLYSNGVVASGRLAKEKVASSYELARTPALSEVFDRSFLPPKAERFAPSASS